MRKAIDDLELGFFAAMDDDFNTGGAIGVIHKLANAARAVQDAGGGFVEHVDRIEKLLTLLGFPVSEFALASSAEADQSVENLIRSREQARKDRDFPLRRRYPQAACRDGRYPRRSCGRDDLAEGVTPCASWALIPAF